MNDPSDLITALALLGILALFGIVEAVRWHFDKKQRRAWFRHWRQM